ncbi:MAG: choice-of-anchor B family protein, partial [Bacteroidota bacterium]
HNLYIDTETGYGFLAGCNLNNGGVIIIDLFTDAGHPIYVAAAAPVYAHDVYTRGNFIYSSDINDGTFAIQDMTDKNNIFTVATQRTPFAFTHNAWLSDDSKVIFTTDERGNASVGAYDISDMNNIEYLDEFRPLGSLNEGLIPHNVHVIDNYLVTSFYTEGVIITDAKRPNNLIEVGNYDTFGGPNGGFNGTWGAFPFFDSGIVLATDIRSGLFVLQPTYTRACYLEGITTDSITGLPLEGVTVRIVSDDPNLDISRASGEYRTGQVTPGTFEVVFSRPNYTSKTISVNLSNGELTALNVSLAPEQDLVSSIPLLNEVIEFNVFPNPFVQQTNVQLAFSDLPNAAELVVTDFLGRIVERQPITQKRNNFIIGQNWESGIYTLQIIAKNRASLPLKIIKN